MKARERGGESQGRERVADLQNGERNGGGERSRFRRVEREMSGEREVDLESREREETGGEREVELESGERGRERDEWER